jgi:D-aspartate ligase
MGYKNIRVLLTDGGSRQTLPMAKAFADLGCIVTTLNSTSLDLGNISRYPKGKIVIKGVDNNAELAYKKVEELLKTKKYDLVLPMSDFTANILGQNKEYFSQYAVIETNDTEVFNLAYDKLNTMTLCMETGLPCPKTILNFGSIQDMKEIDYPVVVKPRSACGSIGFHTANNEEELTDILNKYNKTLGPMFVQEYIPQTGKQFNVHMFLDQYQNVKTALVAEKCRWFPIDGGASTLCVTVNRPDIIDICSRMLKKMKWIGYCDVDLILDPRDNIPKIIEVNARISANVKLCYLAGINIAKQILENRFGQDVTEYGAYKEDIRLRCLHTDLLWFIKSKDRLKTSPSWFSYKNTSDQIFSISDPLPGFTFTIQAFLKYRKEMKKRARLR